MKVLNTVIALFLLNLLVMPISSAEEAIVNAAKVANNSNTTLTDSGFDQRGYFTVRPDLRKCLFPLCGGYFVKAVNRTLTPCPDGSLKSECYIASLNNREKLNLSSAVLLQGVIRTKNYGEFGNLGIFLVKAAFSAATQAIGDGTFVGLENNGIVCITTPCFSVDQYLLNKNKIRVISGIDLQGVGATDVVLNTALSIMANDGVLIASGSNQQVEEMAGKGITFVANQLYLPIKDSVK